MNNLTPEQTARYESLKATGFIRLKADEKAEYQALVGLIKGAPVSAPVSAPQQVSAPTPKGDTVTVSKTAFDEIVARLNKLEGETRHDLSLDSNKEWESVDSKPKVLLATMRTFNGRQLIDWKFDRKQWNERLQAMEDIYKIRLLAEDGAPEEWVEMTTSEFAKLPRQEIKILEVEVQKLRKVVGKVRAVHHDFDSYGKHNKVGSLIDEDVKALKRVFKIELVDGRRLTVDERILNS